LHNWKQYETANLNHCCEQSTNIANKLQKWVVSSFIATTWTWKIKLYLKLSFNTWLRKQNCRCWCKQLICNWVLVKKVVNLVVMQYYRIQLKCNLIFSVWNTNLNLLRLKRVFNYSAIIHIWLKYIIRPKIFYNYIWLQWFCSVVCYTKRSLICYIVP
jgi:hypothetical protein